MTAGTLDEGEVIRRLRTIDLDTLARTSYWLQRGGDLMADAAADVVRLLEQAAESWQSDDGTAALDELRTCQDGLIRGSVAFEEMAAALDRLAPDVDDARRRSGLGRRSGSRREQPVNPCLHGEAAIASNFAEISGDPRGILTAPTVN